MFFSFSKIAWALIAPLNFLFLLFCAAALLVLLRRRKTGLGIMLCAVALFAVLGASPLGPNLLAGLENRYERPETLPAKIDGIVVLGGIIDPDVSRARGQPAVASTVERILEGRRLAELNPNAILVFSGGEGRLRPRGQPEAGDIDEFLRTYGLETVNIFYEDESRTTWENVKFTQDLLMPQPGENWLLVTSAYHMPRAMAVFKSLGWADVIPWPVDYKTDGQQRWKPQRFNVGGNLHDADLALHEYAGRVGYLLSKKTTSF